jgi:phytoene dehydrogenase-like protein
MHYDAIIIGASMSGLAAGIRLAYFDKRVLILERHYAYGGLNSYYRLDGRDFDVGLHAVTNFCNPTDRSAPLSKLLRQLRLTRDDFDLRPQRYSEIKFPDRRLRFSNDFALLEEQVASEFPESAERFHKFVADLREFNDTDLSKPYVSARKTLEERLGDPLLIEMLLCPIMYYGSAEPHDMDFTQFVTMFKSLFLEGFGRPPDGVRKIIKALVKKYRAVGGEIRMKSGVAKIDTNRGCMRGVTLDNGETLTADVVFSSAGYVETMALCGDETTQPSPDETGAVSFVESIAILDTPPAKLGHDATIVFFNDSATFTYAPPNDLVDLRSGVVCCPNNYEDHDHLAEGIFRVTWLASPTAWFALSESTYRDAKARCNEHFRNALDSYIPGGRDRIVCTDMFTPLTIQRFTGHRNGAVYGSPKKRRDGCTPVENLYICGTDQGFLGIVGAMLSGITVANLHVLSKA